MFSHFGAQENKRLKSVRLYLFAHLKSQELFLKFRQFRSRFRSRSRHQFMPYFGSVSVSVLSYACFGLGFGLGHYTGFGRSLVSIQLSHCLLGDPREIQLQKTWSDRKLAFCNGFEKPFFYLLLNFGIV